MVMFLAIDTKAISNNEETNTLQEQTDKYISNVYEKIHFPKNGTLRFEVFRSAFYGYLNLLEDGKIERENILSICDFTMSSNKKRLWIIDLKNKKVLYHSLVAHGMGSGEEFATQFSNIQDSHQSSLGFYITQETYSGNNGYSLKLNGVDRSFNNNAYDRAIVIHGAEYVSEQFAKNNQRLGRSHGCPALPTETATAIIDKIKNGTCLFIYHTANNYLTKSHWLNSTIRTLPIEAQLLNLKPQAELNCENNVESTHNNTKTLAQRTELKQIPKEKVITSVIYVNYNKQTGVSDTCIAN